MLTARATTRSATSSEITSSAIIMSLAQDLIAETSVGLNAIAVVGLVSIIACSNAQITTAGQVPVGLWRLRESTSHSGPAAPGTAMFDTSRPSPGSVAT